MEYKTSGIVLKRIPYSDSQLIVHVFTREYGRIAIMLRGGKSQRSKYKRNLASPLQILDTVLYKSSNSEIYRFKEVRHNYIFRNINNDIKRSSIAMYLTEFFNKVIRSNENHSDFFDFCKSCIIYLDKEQSVENLHLFVLAKSLIYMGVKPNLTLERKQYFDILKGELVSTHGINSLDSVLTNILRCILESDIYDIGQIRLSVSQRREFLEKMEEYWVFHFEGFSRSRSLKVLQHLWS